MMRLKTSGICPKAGKRIFKTFKRALHAQVEVERAFGHLQRIYECPTCLFWHLASQ